MLYLGSLILRVDEYDSNYIKLTSGYEKKLNRNRLINEDIFIGFYDVIYLHCRISFFLLVSRDLLNYIYNSELCFYFEGLIPSVIQNLFSTFD